MKCFCRKKKKNSDQAKTMATTTMTMNGVNEEVMKGLMDILVRRLAAVFEKDEKEVSEAVSEEMKAMLEAYKMWTLAITISGPMAPKAA